LLYKQNNTQILGHINDFSRPEIDLCSHLAAVVTLYQIANWPEYICPGHNIGFIVPVLPEQMCLGFTVKRADVLIFHGTHNTGSVSWVLNGHDHVTCLKNVKYNFHGYVLLGKF
jgi:hypothetical protein